MRVTVSWLKDYVDIRGSIEAVAEKLTMGGLEVTSLTKVDHDTILEIEVTPNRTDCLSVVGIAREIAAVTGKRLTTPKIPHFRGNSNLRIPIQIQDKKLCPRYLGRVIKNVGVRPSPEWLVQRLEVMGVRAVNNIVDITNFCLLELGQPLHAFDLDKLPGQTIIVRRAKPGERIVTIDGVNRELDSATLVIADKSSPQAIAGIMGAKDSEVSESTRTLVLESAYFDPLNIHRTSRRLGLASQSSYRFERGVDLAGVELCSLRATELIKQLSGRQRKKSKAMVIGSPIDKGTKAQGLNKVRLRYRRVEELLGVEISPAQIKEIMRRLQFAIARRSRAGLSVQVPSSRPDITREADLIEEVARLYGYDKIPLALRQLAPDLSSAGNLALQSAQTYDSIRQILASLGLNEIVTYSLISRANLRKLELPVENAIAVKNPLSYTQEILRPTLLVGMLSTLVANINRQNQSLKLFELSRIYTRGQTPRVEELTNLCIGIVGKRGENWLTKVGEYSFFDLKGILQMLLDKLGVEGFTFVEQEAPLYTRGRSASIRLGGEDVGLFGELTLAITEKFDLPASVYVAELALNRLLTHIHPEKKFTPLAKFPSVERDISLIAPVEVRSEQIASLIKKVGGDLVTKITLFDQYFGEQIPQGSRGLSFSIEYRSFQRTLTTEEVDKLHGLIRRALSEELKVQIR